jgi:hypothetical protein
MLVFFRAFSSAASADTFLDSVDSKIAPLDAPALMADWIAEVTEDMLSSFIAPPTCASGVTFWISASQARIGSVSVGTMTAGAVPPG